MAHKKGLGSSKNGRDSNAQRLGVKAFGGQLVPGGTIIVQSVPERLDPDDIWGLAEREKVNLLYWQLTCRSFYETREWEWFYEKAGYRGDYSFIFFE